MSSNVYVARGERGGVDVMKVGKTNNIRQRQSELGITIELSISQPDAAAALNLETHLRLFVLTKGGKRLPRTTDWFYFDPQIYAALCAAVAELNEEDDCDAEIAALRERYHRLLADEAERNAEVGRRFDLEREERLKAAKQEHLAELQRELAELRKKFAAASERFCQEKDNPKEFLPREIWELNWSIVRLEAELKPFGLFL
jgi:hypothetical protein